MKLYKSDNLVEFSIYLRLWIVVQQDELSSIAEIMHDESSTMSLCGLILNNSKDPLEFTLSSCSLAFENNME